ncbi:MAG: hypothetical protein M3256_01410 [Actinomycetota bacterium]|nr:hypothetical protein [Actinomycetota bacterium]
MNSLSRLADTPLVQLLGGVSAHVFQKMPRTIGMRDLSRDMATTLAKLRTDESYTVLTMRGAPSFLLIPIDPQAWSSLLVATAPDAASARDEANDPTGVVSAEELLEEASVAEPA